MSTFDWDDDVLDACVDEDGTSPSPGPTQSANGNTTEDYPVSLGNSEEKNSSSEVNASTKDPDANEDHKHDLDDETTIDNDDSANDDPILNVIMIDEHGVVHTLSIQDYFALDPRLILPASARLLDVNDEPCSSVTPRPVFGIAPPPKILNVECYVLPLLPLNELVECRNENIKVESRELSPGECELTDHPTLNQWRCFYLSASFLYRFLKTLHYSFSFTNQFYMTSLNTSDSTTPVVASHTKIS
ncbi:hypothetical protein BJ875DRAFT_513838 [Amylocarpus encephaloides]|uniref:Uncharacterized protein n=1 Tax=Amylocarpus encephaloides TaxID=45428 RepID=A0A9P8C420_9HELO|nr:hypothetical protein BJ875DRAFT_513838 [Amylocarpus encephaloides]